MRSPSGLARKISGSPDDWLTKVRADVIFAFYGFNESFKAPCRAPGPVQGRTSDKFLKETLVQKLFRQRAIRMHRAFFSHRERKDIRTHSNFPDPTANNANLLEYTAAMAEVAKANGVMFLDLFHPSLELYAAAARRGTIAHHQRPAPG